MRGIPFGRPPGFDVAEFGNDGKNGNEAPLRRGFQLLSRVIYVLPRFEFVHVVGTSDRPTKHRARGASARPRSYAGTPAQYNLTDPESRIMPTRQDCYNAQQAVDADS